ncbi:MAG: hypothetical protein QM765_26720 [Myxococcales bacterium]
MKKTAVAVIASLALVPAPVLADPPRGFGALDLGGALAAPLSGGGANRWYLGAALEGGLELNDLLQVGARVRFFPGSAGEHENGLRWGLNVSAGSASALARLTFEPTDGLGISAGLSVGYALFGDCYTNGTRSSSCGGSGIAAGLDVRVEWLARQHFGLHLSVEPQLVFRLEREATVFVPAAWLGVDW